MPDQLTIYVHLPPITTNQESEACRDNTLNAIAARVRRKKKCQNVAFKATSTSTNYQFRPMTLEQA